MRRASLRRGATGILPLLLTLAAALQTGCLECGGKAPPPAPAGEAAAAEHGGTARLADAPRVDDGVPTDPAATVRLALEAEPSHLNPLLGADAMVSRVALGDLYEGLLCSDGFDAPPRPCLAERYEVSADERVFTFYLRSGVRWHDGQPVTMRDVRYSLSLVIGEGAIASALVGEFDDVVSVVEMSERAVRIEFAGARSGRLGAFVRLVILPQHHFQGVRGGKMTTSSASAHPIGTGPLRLDEWKRGIVIRLSRFDDYWGTPAAAAVVEHRIFGDREQAKRAFVAGDLDLLFSLPSGEVRALLAEAGGKTVEVKQPSYLAAVLNCRSTPLADAQVRQALAHLLDREAIVREVLDGAGEVMTGPFLSTDPAFDPAVPAPAFDRGAAAALVGKSRPAASLLVPSESRSMMKLADIWAADASGQVQLTVEAVPFAMVLERVREGRFELALLGLTTSLDVDVFAQFHSSGIGGENLSGIADARLDELLVALRAATGAERATQGRPVHRRLAELMPYVFIASDVRLGAARQDLVGVERGRGAARFIGRKVATAP